jgi:hypothetical protein
MIRLFPEQAQRSYRTNRIFLTNSINTRGSNRDFDKKKEAVSRTLDRWTGAPRCKQVWKLEPKPESQRLDHAGLAHQPFGSSRLTTTRMLEPPHAALTA